MSPMPSGSFLIRFKSFNVNQNQKFDSLNTDVQPDEILQALPKSWDSLARAFVSTARENWSKSSMADSLGVQLTYGQALIRAIGLAAAFRREIKVERYVGVMLPPSVPAAIANIAIHLLGKIPVNLNYSASQDAIDHAIARCKIETTITSQKFMDRIKLTPKGRSLLLEEMPKKVGIMDKLWAIVAARTIPMTQLGAFLPGLRDVDLSKTATVMFTSGSTGEPKGVVLTHGNVLSNVHQMRQHLRLDPLPVVALGILPFFHSFGHTVGIWTILLLGKKAVYHTNPLDAKIVADLCEKHQITLLAASPTFFRHYIQRGKPEQFRHLVHILLGAEKLKPDVADQIEEKIHVDPLEGYGTTEMSPVAAVNVPFSIDLAGGRQVSGNRRGSVGRPLPGTCVRTTDPESGEILPRGVEGMIHIKGPQIMAGYLENPEATAKVLVDGWYSSGDIGRVDEDGFLYVTGRLSRFAKIAGEMVPHEGIEAALIAAGLDEGGVAVTSVPDDKRGERLVVLHQPMRLSAVDVCRKLGEKGLPRIWVPSADDFYEVPEIPTLATGKLDLRKIIDLALQKVGR